MRRGGSEVPRGAPRVGLIVPSSNTVVEPDFASAGLQASIHTARMYLAETTEPAERVMLEHHLPTAIRDIATMAPDVVAFACTSAGAVLGAAGEEELIASISDQTGAAVVSTNRAVKDSLASLEARAIAVLTPYVDELNDRIEAGLVHGGFRVVVVAGMGIVENLKIAEVEPHEIVEFGRRALSGLTFDAVFVSCTNLRALAARRALQRTFNRPVVTSNQATIDAVGAALRTTEVERDSRGRRPSGVTAG